MKMNQDQLSTEWSSYDLALSATLITLGYQLKHTDKSHPSKVKFVFESDPAIQKIVNGFWSDNLLVNPRSMFDNLRLLKSQIYSS